MISTKLELKRYVQQDADQLKRASIKANFFGDECWKFQLLLRKTEYHHNSNNLINKVLYPFYKLRLHKLSIKLGFSISLNCFGPGLQIMHRGTIVINDKVKVGENCRIHVCVNIGEGSKGKAPTLGDGVYIGPGTKIFGDVSIADNVVIGANAVVNKSIDQPGISIGGIPAKPLHSS